MLSIGMTRVWVSGCVALVASGCHGASLTAARSRNQVTLDARFEPQRPIRVTTILRVKKTLSLHGHPAVLWDESQRTVELCPLPLRNPKRNELYLAVRTVDWNYQQQDFDQAISCSPREHQHADCAVEAFNASLAWTAQVSSDGAVTLGALTFDQAQMARLRVDSEAVAASLIAPSLISATTQALLWPLGQGTRHVGEVWAVPPFQSHLLGNDSTSAHWKLVSADGTTARLQRVVASGAGLGMAIRSSAQADVVTGWVRSIDEDLQVVQGEGANATVIHVVLSQRVQLGSPNDVCH